MIGTSPRRLYILAMDHRGSFEKALFGLQGAPHAQDVAHIADAKRVIYEGLLEAVRQGAPNDAAGVLVDEEFGTAIARAAKADGLILAMPVEKSGLDEFDFEYGPDYRRHVETFDPDYTKVLVRYNPDGDAALNRHQAGRLHELSDWLHQSGRRFLFELLVPPTHEELEEAGSVDSYDHSQRPALVVRALAELQSAGVEPNIWKIEGIDTREDCNRVSAQARSGGREHVRCIVLGRGADEKRVEEWLRQGARAEGYAGFAIGRTIWFDALHEMLAGRIDRQEASRRITRRYLRAIEVYESAALDA